MSQPANRISYPLYLWRILYRVSSTVSTYKPSLTPSFSTTVQSWHRLQMPFLPLGLTASTTVRQMEPLLHQLSPGAIQPSTYRDHRKSTISHGCGRTNYYFRRYLRRRLRARRGWDCLHCCKSDERGLQSDAEG